jgi:hypothetical protein
MIMEALLFSAITWRAPIFRNNSRWPRQQYAHLHRELFDGGELSLGGDGTLWALNASKAWVTGSWLYIPITLATQIALIPFTDFARFQCSYFQSSFGHSELLPERRAELSRLSKISNGYSLAMPNFGYHLARLLGSLVRRCYRILLPLIARRRVVSPCSVELEVFAYSNEESLPEQVASIRSFLRYVGRRCFHRRLRMVRIRRARLPAPAFDSVVSVRQPEAVPADLPAVPRHKAPTGKQLPSSWRRGARPLSCRFRRPFLPGSRASSCATPHAGAPPLLSGLSICGDDRLKKE